MKMNKGKVLLAATGTFAAGAAFCICTGAAIHYRVLSKKACTCYQEQQRYSSENLKSYFSKDDFRIADDWFCTRAKEETVLINECGEELSAQIIKSDQYSHKWAITVHGLTDIPREMARQGYHYFTKGYNIILPCQRAHGNSKIKNCSMGYFERFDIISWINYIISEDPEAEIILHGCSMGAATVMMVAGEKLSLNVKAIIADCGYTDCYEEFKDLLKIELGLSCFPFLDITRFYEKLFHGWDLKECSPLKAVAKSKTPILFIHGKNDDYVPFTMMNSLYNACSAQKEKLAVPGAGHDESCDKQPELYWNTTDAFIRKYISG